MCGRYRLKDPKKAFDWLEVVPSFEFHPRFNIAPSQRVPVVTGAGRVEEMIWGIVPAWATTSKALINARSESVREKRLCTREGDPGAAGNHDLYRRSPTSRSRSSGMGEGILWLHGYGNVFEKDLAPGEQIDVEPGGWLYKEATVKMETNIQRLSIGVFAGMNLVMNHFTGPGRIALQAIAHGGLRTSADAAQ